MKFLRVVSGFVWKKSTRRQGFEVGCKCFASMELKVSFHLSNRFKMCRWLHLPHTTPLQKLSNKSPEKIQRVRWIYGYWKVHLTWLSLKWHSGPAGFLWLLKKNTVLKKLRPQPPEGALQHSTHLFNGNKNVPFLFLQKANLLRVIKGENKHLQPIYLQQCSKIISSGKKI